MPATVMATSEALVSKGAPEEARAKHGNLTVEDGYLVVDGYFYGWSHGSMMGNYM